VLPTREVETTSDSLFFPNYFAGVQVLIIGLLEGTIVVRSCLSMKILFNLDQSICHTKAIWSLVDMGHSCFGAGSDDGNVVVWTVRGALVDK
jgi:hypothetical protein